MKTLVEKFLDEVIEAHDQIKHYYASGTILDNISDVYVLADDIRSAADKLMNQIGTYERSSKVNK